MSESNTFHPTDTAVIALARHGWFFVGGGLVERAEGTFRSGGMYVEYYVPAEQRHTMPVVMFHGGGQTGTNFTGTPDGRHGWAHDFLLAGYAVYVVDQPERGRSGHLADPQGNYSLVRYSAERIEERFTACAQHRLWPQAMLHDRWPGSGLRGEPVFDQFLASQVQMSPDRVLMERMVQDAGAALLDRIGPAIILTHSQSGPFGWLLADARPDRVAAIVAIEPNGPPFFELEFEPAHDGENNGTGAGLVGYRYQVEVTRHYGIAHAPLVFEPAAGRGGAPEPVFVAAPCAAGLVPGYQQVRPARRLPNLAAVPTLLVTAEASYHAPYDHLTSTFLSEAGVAHEHLYLHENGLCGNGHMMMLELNNHKIADLLLGWLEKVPIRAHGVQ